MRMNVLKERMSVIRCATTTSVPTLALAIAPPPSIPMAFTVMVCYCNTCLCIPHAFNFSSVIEQILMNVPWIKITVLKFVSTHTGVSTVPATQDTPSMQMEGHAEVY